VVYLVFIGKCWRICCGITIATLISLSLLVVGIAMYWAIEVIKYRSHIMESQDLSSSAVYNITSDFPLSNIFSTSLCLNSQDAHVKKYTVDKLAHISLAVEDCETVIASTYNESVTEDSVFGHNYMFYWLSGTTVSFDAVVNGSSTMSVFLLESKRSFDLCTNHITPSPDDYLKMWAFNLSNCFLTATGYMECRFQYETERSGYFYICVNSTIEYDLQFNISITSIEYNISKSRTVTDCVPDKECCLPFKNIFKELYHPTCVFVNTTPLSPSFRGIKLTEITVRVDQRLDVFWYCLAALFPLLLVLVVTIIFCKATRRKFKNPDINGRGCIMYCNIYSNDHYHDMNRL
jgi:hypothetical protein